MSAKSAAERLLLVTLLLLLGAGVSPVLAQEASDPLLAAFQENFRRASEETKLDILRDSVNYEPEVMGPLYVQAVEYVVNNSDKLQTDVKLQEIALEAARLAGLSSYKPAALPLIELFEVYDDTRVRIAALDGLKADSIGNERALLFLNRWVERQITLFRAGGGVNTQVLAEAVVTLGSYRDPRTFPHLLSVSVLGLSKEVTSRAREALKGIEGDYASMVAEVIEEYPAAEKLVALRTAVEREGMPKEDTAGVATQALVVGNRLAFSDPASAAQVREMRALAARTLGELRWAEATPQLIEHFDLCILELDRGLGTKSALLEAVAALGSMGTREAAVRLALYLDVINSYVESNQGYDEQITLAVVRNLGKLKSKAGLNALLYLGYLDYSKSIRDAAEVARRAILGQ
jgi:PBS lyase HEAT-like repeat